MRLPPSVVRHVPIRSKFSSENPIGSMILWQAAHDRIVAVLLHPLPDRRGLLRALSFSFNGGTLGGGRGGGVPRRFSRTHLPRATGDVRLATDVTSRKLAWPSKPRRSRPERVTRRNRLPMNVRNSVVPGQSLVHVRVVGIEQIHHAAVFAHDAFEKQLRLAPKRLPQVIVESTRLGSSTLQLAQVQPLPAEVGRQRLRTRIRQHAQRLLFEHQRDRAACPERPGPAVRRQEYCSTGRMTSARPVPDR